MFWSTLQVCWVFWDVFTECTAVRTTYQCLPLHGSSRHLAAESRRSSSHARRSAGASRTLAASQMPRPQQQRPRRLRPLPPRPRRQRRPQRPQRRLRSPLYAHPPGSPSEAGRSHLQSGQGTESLIQCTVKLCGTARRPPRSSPHWPCGVMTASTVRWRHSMSFVTMCR